MLIFYAHGDLRWAWRPEHQPAGTLPAAVLKPIGQIQTCWVPCSHRFPEKKVVSDQGKGRERHHQAEKEHL